METFTTQEKKAARILQGDIPLVARPFADIADRSGLADNHLIPLLKRLSRSGILRKFGAVLRHQNAGYRENAMVMWHVPSDAVESAGKTFESLPYVSHCYERSPAFQNKYNLFTMVHGKDETISSLITAMSRKIDCDDFLVLESLQEYKKTSPEYF
jgi:DNA-binding Lrp family transcriptional regulator